jgi:hypothetical protein
MGRALRHAALGLFGGIVLEGRLENAPEIARAHGTGLEGV